jgi:hypothetical protein
VKYLLSIIILFNIGFTQSFGEKLVTIKTKPMGADIYLNGKSIGVSPCTVRLTNGVLTPKQMLRIEMVGFKTKLQTLDQKIIPSIGCAGLGCGVITWIGFIALLWATEFEDTYHYHLQPLNYKNNIKFDPNTGEQLKT